MESLEDTKDGVWRKQKIEVERLSKKEDIYIHKSHSHMTSAP